MTRQAFANQFAFDPAKPLVIPLGDYPHKATGKTQRITADTAVAWMQQILHAQEQGAPGLPVYVGHPDVPHLAARYPDKRAVGWITGAFAGNGEISLPVQWVHKPDPGDFVYFSPYQAGTVDGAYANIDELRSVGLTNKPNDTRLRLPNEDADPPSSTGDTHVAPSNPNPPGATEPMQQLNTLLALAEDAGPEDQAAAIQALLDEKAALTAQLEDLQRKQEEATAETEAAQTEATEAKAALANEREARIGLVLDGAIATGKVTPATRPLWEQRLRADFANESVNLGKAVEFKTRTVLANEDASQPSGIVAKYDAMPAGPEKAAFLQAHASEIHDARVALANENQG